MKKKVADFSGKVTGTGQKAGGNLLGQIPPEFILALGQVCTHGAAKYAPGNWLNGYEWSKSYDALQRHLQAFWSGEVLDPESGLPHLAHAAWHCAALLTYSSHEQYKQFDNRLFSWLRPSSLPKRK